jgi:hypothetical protein
MARTRRLASTPQAAAILLTGYTAKGSRRALWKLRATSPGAGSRTNLGRGWLTAPRRLLVLNVLSGPYVEPLDYPATRI